MNEWMKYIALVFFILFKAFFVNQTPIWKKLNIPCLLLRIEHENWYLALKEKGENKIEMCVLTVYILSVDTTN